MSDLLGGSQPTTLTITMLDKMLYVTGNVAKETPPQFKIEVVIVV
jgi:hypothetical protein